MKSDKISLIILALELAAIIYLHAARPLAAQKASLASDRPAAHTQLTLTAPPLLGRIK